MADEVLVDALPYYDAGYEEPGVRQAVSYNQTLLIIIKFYILYFLNKRR